MNTKVYIENLDLAITPNELSDLFSPYGNVSDVNIVVDPTSRKPNGFGFVTMATPEGARSAIRALNGKTVGTGVLIAGEGWTDEEPVGAPSGRPKPRRAASQLF